MALLFLMEPFTDDLKRLHRQQDPVFLVSWQSPTTEGEIRHKKLRLRRYFRWLPPKSTKCLLPGELVAGKTRRLRGENRTFDAKVIAG